MTSKIIAGWIQWPKMQLFFKFQVDRMKIDNFRNSAYVVLLTYVDLKNNSLVEFSDLKHINILFKFQVNRMKIDYFRNSAYVDLLAYVDLQDNWWLNSVTWLILYILFKFQVNRMKIEDFGNTTLVVDLVSILTFWSMLTSKIIGWLNSMSENINLLQISSQSDEIWGFKKSWLRFVDLMTIWHQKQ